MYVYLLVESGRQSVKIGKSNNPVRRSNELAQRFDLDYSRQVFMGSERDAYALERTLHFLFRDHNLDRDKCDGYSEWFSAECYEDVKNWITSHQHLLKGSGLQPLGQANEGAPQPEIKRRYSPGFRTAWKIYEKHKEIDARMKEATDRWCKSFDKERSLKKWEEETRRRWNLLEEERQKLIAERDRLAQLIKAEELYHEYCDAVEKIGKLLTPSPLAFATRIEKVRHGRNKRAAENFRRRLITGSTVYWGAGDKEENHPLYRTLPADDLIARQAQPFSSARLRLKQMIENFHHSGARDAEQLDNLDALLGY